MARRRSQPSRGLPSCCRQINLPGSWAAGSSSAYAAICSLKLTVPPGCFQADAAETCTNADDRRRRQHQEADIVNGGLVGGA